MSETHVDVYPVGVLRDYIDVVLGQQSLRTALRRVYKRTKHYVKRRQWRAIRNMFNGYLAEHPNHPHNCGKGWTVRAATRRVDKICRNTKPPLFFNNSDGTVSVWDGENWYSLTDI